MSGTSSSCSPVPSTKSFAKFEKRISLQNLLKEANLDKDALLEILKQNHVGINDLDESKIQSIIIKAQTTMERKKEDCIIENDINSHYKIIKKECIELRESMKGLQNKMKLESHLNNIKHKKQHNERLLTLQHLSGTKHKLMIECSEMKAKYESECDLVSLKIRYVESEIENIVEEQQNLLLKKIALQQNVSQCRSKLEIILTQKKRFREMRDISQFKPIAVFYVLKYLEIDDFISCILCCKAWYFSLHKASYFRVLQRNVFIEREKQKQNTTNAYDVEELVSSKTKLKRINHAVMQLKLGGKTKTPRPDDIYTECMQQLQKVIAQSIQDREELEDRVKAQMGILRFMQASMYGKMQELSYLRVRKWELKNKSLNGYQIEKKELHEKIKNFEIELNKSRIIIENMKENMRSQQEIRIKKFKIQKDLKSVKSGTANIEQMNELKKLKQQTKKLAQVIVQLRKEIPKRNHECKKYKNRVDLLQSQYTQHSNDPLP